MSHFFNWRCHFWHDRWLYKQQLSNQPKLHSSGVVNMKHNHCLCNVFRVVRVSAVVRLRFQTLQNPKAIGSLLVVNCQEKPSHTITSLMQTMIFEPHTTQHNWTTWNNWNHWHNQHNSPEISWITGPARLVEVRSIMCLLTSRTICLVVHCFRHFDYLEAPFLSLSLLCCATYIK